MQNLDILRRASKFEQRGCQVGGNSAKRGQAPRKILTVFLVWALIFAPFLGFSQPVNAGPSSYIDGSYSTLTDFVQRLGPEAPQSVPAEQPKSPLAESHPALIDFVQRIGPEAPQSVRAEQPKSPLAESHPALIDFVQRIGTEPPQSPRADQPNSPAAEPYQVLAQSVGRGESVDRGARRLDSSAPQNYREQQAEPEQPIVVPATDPSPADPLPADPWAHANATYVGSQVCLGCHLVETEHFEKTLMGRIFLQNPRTSQERLGCEACHGPASEHVAAGGGLGVAIMSFRPNSPIPLEQRNAVCLDCHEAGKQTFWQGSPHQTRGVACTDCHQAHQEDRTKFVKATEIETCFQCHQDKRAQQARFSRHPLLEGKMTCSSCHNPHGTANFALLDQPTVNETCYECHAEKRGPFLWEHAPVRENCASCHEPHGTNHASMLTVQPVRLCQQCHTESGHPANPQNPLSRFAFSRGCANCHSAVHGSNSPAGVRLQR
jgi:DmsE family decaheme c-type cytochrome